MYHVVTFPDNSVGIVPKAFLADTVYVEVKKSFTTFARAEDFIIGCYGYVVIANVDNIAIAIKSSEISKYSFAHLLRGFSSFDKAKYFAEAFNKKK